MIQLNDDQLRQLLQPYGLTQADIRFLGGGKEYSDGTVYAYDRDGQPMAVKIMALEEPEERFAQTIAAYEERVRFANYLSSHGAAIVGPVASADGSIYHSSRDGGYSFISYIMPRVDGANPPPEQWDAAFYRAWGQAIGRMHRLAVAYPHWQHSPTNDAQGNPILNWRREVSFFQQWCRDEQVSAAWRAIEARLETLPVERSAFGFIHNDPHTGNLLYDGNALHIIDFDVANYHWFATDITIAAQPMLFMKCGGLDHPLADSEAFQAFFREFMAGYALEHRLEDYWLEQLDLFVQYRRLLLFTAMQDWIDSNAPVKESWKNMIATAPPIFGTLKRM